MSPKGLNDNISIPGKLMDMPGTVDQIPEQPLSNVAAPYVRDLPANRDGKQERNRPQNVVCLSRLSSLKSQMTIAPRMIAYR